MGQARVREGGAVWERGWTEKRNDERIELVHTYRRAAICC